MGQHQCTLITCLKLQKNSSLLFRYRWILSWILITKFKKKKNFFGFDRKINTKRMSSLFLLQLFLMTKFTNIICY